jgi:hypothetical protein
MAYAFELIGISPVLTFFNQQQRLEKTPQRSKAYVGSYECTLDAFIGSTEMIHKKPSWNWDEVISTIIDFWLSHGDSIDHWRYELSQVGNENLLVARVVNMEILRQEFESLFEE